MITTSEIKDFINNESGVSFSVISETNDRLTIKIDKGLHQFTISGDNIQWGIWIGNSYDVQGYFNREKLFDNIKYIY